MAFAEKVVAGVGVGRRGVYLFMKLYSRWPPVWETAVHLAVAGGVFDGVFCAVLFSH